MRPSDRRKIEGIADEFMSTFPLFFRMVIRDDTGLATRKFDPSRMVLGAIMAHGQVPMSAIGAHMGISRPYMTALIDKLIAEGLVKRVEDPDDRRVTYIVITKAGKQALSEFKRSRKEMMVRNLSVLTTEEISSLESSAKTIRNIASSLEKAAKNEQECGR